MTQPPTATRRKFRADIEGLRAIAVGMVVTYHLWPHAFSGGFVGVDVFFVISGYLITSHLITRPPRNVRDLGDFWARRVRRLLPAALAVLGVVLLASWLVGAQTQWKSTAADVIAAAFYVSNWKFAADSVDYLAAQGAASPVQHYWSLSVEEQFYLLWPILILVLFRITKSWNRSSIRVPVLAVCGLSFITGVILTTSSPESAYFVTHTRIWELAVGGAVATLVPLSKRVVSPLFSSVVAWAGIALVASAGLFLNSSMPYPGVAATLPVAGTAFVIWSHAQGSGAPGHLLAWPPIQWIGGISYAIYLWHWPLIVFAEQVLGDRTFWVNVAIGLTTIVLAAGSKLLIEDRFRQPRGPRPTRRALLTAAAGMAIVAVGASGQIMAVQHSDQKQEQRVAALKGGPCFGANALLDADRCADQRDVPALMSPAAAAEDKPVLYDDGCLIKSPYKIKTCTYGSGKTKVALVGNSHAGQWLAPLIDVAKRNGWEITTYFASTCTATDAELAYGSPKTAQACNAWGKDVLEATSGDEYDLVITTERNVLPVQGHSAKNSYEAWKNGYESYLRAWDESGTNVLVLHDTPFPGATRGAVPDCLAQADVRAEDCSGKRTDWEPKDPLYAAAGAFHGNISRESLNNAICEPDRCSPVVGGVIVYFDESHLTETYAESLTPVLEPVVLDAVHR